MNGHDISKTYTIQIQRPNPNPTKRSLVRENKDTHPRFVTVPGGRRTVKSNVTAEGPAKGRNNPPR